MWENVDSRRIERSLFLIKGNNSSTKEVLHHYEESFNFSEGKKGIENERDQIEEEVFHEMVPTSEEVNMF